MRWYHYLAYFFAGAFLANAIPHFVNGISGNAFQSPFASPPGIGLSSSTVNVLWGFFNFAIGYLLVCRVGSFNLRKTQHVLVFCFNWEFQQESSSSGCSHRKRRKHQNNKCEESHQERKEAI